jgi:hypothetical protein
MTDLDDAWRWYLAIKDQVQFTTRIAGKHWLNLPWDGDLGRDNFLRDVNPGRVVGDAEFVAGQLDDLAVVVLFSVFEATVRSGVLRDIEGEVEGLTHPALRYAVEQAKDGIAEGSFFRVLEPFKSDGRADLVEQVNQVRRYRNWVAHGRRGTKPANVRPEMAYERLKQLLAVIPHPPAINPVPPEAEG